MKLISNRRLQKKNMTPNPMIEEAVLEIKRHTQC